MKPQRTCYREDTVKEMLAELAPPVPGHPSILTLDIERGECAWNPATTKDRPIVGPKVVTYMVHSDGGIDVSTRPAG
jgi:hypothetical protein